MGMGMLVAIWEKIPNNLIFFGYWPVFFNIKNIVRIVQEVRLESNFSSCRMFSTSWRRSWAIAARTWLIHKCALDIPSNHHCCWSYPSQTYPGQKYQQRFWGQNICYSISAKKLEVMAFTFPACRGGWNLPERTDNNCISAAFLDTNHSWFLLSHEFDVISWKQ